MGKMIEELDEIVVQSNAQNEVEKEEKPIILAVYLGQRQKGNTNRLNYHWCSLEGLENDGTEIPDNVLEGQTAIFPKNPVQSIWQGKPFPGAIFRFETANEGQSWYHSKEPVSFWKNNDQVEKWQALSVAHKGNVVTQQKAVKEIRQDVLKDQLKPIKTAYRELPADKRRQLLAYVLEIITGI